MGTEDDGGTHVGLPTQRLSSILFSAALQKFQPLWTNVLDAVEAGVPAHVVAEQLFMATLFHANQAQFVIELDSSESDMRAALRQRVFWPTDLGTVMELVSPLLSVLKENPEHHAAVATDCRIGRKHVLLSVALFFSECKLDLLCIFDANSLIVRIYQLPAATPPNTLRRCQALTESRQRRFPFPSRNRLDLRHRQ